MNALMTPIYRSLAVIANLPGRIALIHTLVVVSVNVTHAFPTYVYLL